METGEIEFSLYGSGFHKTRDTVVGVLIVKIAFGVYLGKTTSVM